MPGAEAALCDTCDNLILQHIDKEGRAWWMCVGCSPPGEWSRMPMMDPDYGTPAWRARRDQELAAAHDSPQSG